MNKTKNDIEHGTRSYNNLKLLTDNEHTTDNNKKYNNSSSLFKNRGIKTNLGLVPVIRENILTKGFTLLELIVVMAILTILVVIAVPKFGDNIEQANEVKSSYNMRIYEDEIQVKSIADPNYIETILNDFDVDANLVIYTAKGEGRLYGTQGLIRPEDAIGGNFYPTKTGKDVTQYYYSDLTGGIYQVMDMPNRNITPTKSAEDLKTELGGTGT